MMKVLVIEDDQHLSEALQQLLEQAHYTVEVVNNGQDGLDYALLTFYDAIILDVMLPKLSGFEVLKQLRKQGNTTPILLLTAKNTFEDKVKGLDLGADDYLTKPFHTEELLARLRAITRRKGELITDYLIFGDLKLDQNQKRLICHNKFIDLALKEYELCYLLMHNAPQVLSKELLLERIWGFDSNAEDNHVEVYISFLRKKLLYLNSQVKIKTIRKSGYFLELVEIM